MPDENRVFDVTRPGHDIPQATSKPVIVGHRPTMTDPMVKDNNSGDFGAESSPTRIAVSDHPTSDNEIDSPGIIDPKTDAWTPDAPATPPEPGPDASTFNSPVAEPTVSTDEVSPAEPAAAAQPDPNAPLNQTDVMPMGHVEGLQFGQTRRKKPLGLIVLILLVLLVGAYLAVDSGLIKTSVNLPFHIFKQKTATPAAAPAPSTPAAATSTTPANFTEYKLAGTTLTFAAPTAWGTPASTTIPGFTARGGTNKTDGTYAYLVDFATNKDVEVAVTSSKFLPAAPSTLYYDYLQWCVGTSDSKTYLSALHFTTSTDKIDTPATVVCDQGPITDSTKLDSATIFEAKIKNSDNVVLGDLYTKNLTSTDLPVFRVKDATSANATDIKKLLTTIKAPATAVISNSSAGQ